MSEPLKPEVNVPPPTKTALLDRLEHFDRRWIFLVMAFAIVLPLFFPLGLPAEAEPPVKAIYYAVEDLPAGSTVLLSIDLDPSALPELEPFYRSVVLQLKRKRVKLVLLTTWYSAPPLIDRWIGETIERPVAEGDIAYKKNVDYVWLGFREGKQAMIANLGEDMWSTFGGHADDGTPLAQIPMMQAFHRLGDFPLIVLVSGGSPGAKEYVQQVQSRYHLRMVVATTAVSTTDLSPYYSSGQLLGLAGGMSDTATYEKLVGNPGLGAKGLDVLNVGHLVVIAAIVFGNVIFFLGRRRRNAGGVA